MKMKLFLLFLASQLLFIGCSRNANRPYTDDDIIKIYVDVEFSGSKTATETITKYNLSNDKNRHEYYNIVREMTDTPEKYESFYHKVENYKQQVFSSSSNVKTS